MHHGHWAGYSHTEDTCEPEANLNGSTAVLKEYKTHNHVPSSTVPVTRAQSSASVVVTSAYMCTLSTTHAAWLSAFIRHATDAKYESKAHGCSADTSRASRKLRAGGTRGHGTARKSASFRPLLVLYTSSTWPSTRTSSSASGTWATILVECE